MRRINQGGSLASYVAIGVILALVLIGGLYGLKQYNATRSAGDNPSWDGSGETDQKKSDSETPVSEKKDTAKEDPTTTITPKPDEQGTEGQNGDAAKAGDDKGRSSASELPQTGPADTALHGLVIAIISFSLVNYMRSLVYVRGARARS